MLRLQLKGQNLHKSVRDFLNEYLSKIDKLKRAAKPSKAKRPLIKPGRTSGRDKSEDKQLILGRPRPLLRPPFRLNPAALLVPAIPTIIGSRGEVTSNCQ